MDKNELIKYKKFIENLSDEQKKDRKYYLKALATGAIIGPSVGFPSVDEPWLKYVDLDNLYQPRVPKTIYQEIYDNNQENLDNVALEFFGTKIKYKELFTEIDRMANAFIQAGVSKGEFVTICCAGIPEMVYSFYALSKIGACANFMSPFFDPKGMIDRINDCNSKLMIVMDLFYNGVKKQIAESSIEKTVVIPTLNSSFLKFLKPSKVKLEANTVMYKDFIKNVSGKSNINPVPYKYKMPLAMVYSSGSTGAAKAILLSNDSFQNSIHSYEACGINLSGNQKFYQIIPPWFSTGSSTSMHLPLANGAIVFMDPRFEREKFVSNVIKHKINATVAPTSMYEGFLDPKLVKNKDLSHFTNPFQGGEPLKKETKQAIEKVFHQHGATTALKIGYGQCECGAGIATQTDDFYRADGSVGIPIPGVICAIFDENNQELPYGERGEIYVKTDSGMLEYYKNQEATDEYFYKDEAGVVWSRTGDMGMIDVTGNLFVYGRMTDYTMVSNEKIYNFDIENVILADHDIKNVEILSKNGYVQQLIAHLIFKDNYVNLLQTNPNLLTEKLETLQKAIYEKFQDTNYVPKVFKIRTEFPHAKSGKRDIPQMLLEDDNFFEFEGNLGSKVKKI